VARSTSSADATPQAHLEALREQPKEALAVLLAELAATHPEVAERLNRHALAHDPAGLAAAFRKRLQHWQRPSRFLPRSAAAGYGRELETWLDEIERELLPLDPARALELAEAFLSSDAHFFEQADDSDAAIGDAIRAGCRLWLRAAKAQPDTSTAHLIERVCTLFNADEYGAREALLAHADLLFDEAGLRILAARFEADLEQALRGREAGQREHGVYKAAAAIELIADALRDPDLATKTTLRLSPEPNVLEKEHLAERYLRFGRPQDALVWLDGDWEHHEHQRERLLAEVYAALGDSARLRAVRQVLFERTGSPSDFEAWHRSLAPSEQNRAAECARQRAHNLDDPITGARLLLALDDDAAAEALLLSRSANVRGAAYYDLVPLAQVLEQKGRLLGAIVCYRALLVAILARGYAKAYAHGVDYLRALRRLDTQVRDYGALNAHEAFESSIRNAHKRKVSFWNRVAG
jgi:hypothetical protein